MNQQPEMGSIIFGGMAITGLAWGGADLDESKAAIHAALDHGITTFDTAPFYGFGLSEELIGRAIAGQRDRVYIATKIGLRWDGTPGKHHMDVTFGDREYVVNRHAKPDSIVWEVEQSLKRLDTDWIDSLQYHHHDPDTPLEESLSAMQRLVEQGKVRHLGVSNLTVDQIHSLQDVCQIATSQNQYSLLNRTVEDDLLPYCVEHKIDVLAYMALGRGILAGTTTVDREFPDGDHRQRIRYFLPGNIELINQGLADIRPIASDLGITLSQLALAWTLHRPAVRSIIVGIRNPDQVASLAQVSEVNLDQQIVDSIDSTFRNILPRLES
jgi:aryl-alcohol dehydrogenase-like predicted oxidoreductase